MCTGYPGSTCSDINSTFFNFVCEKKHFFHLKILAKNNSPRTRLWGPQFQNRVKNRYRNRRVLRALHIYYILHTSSFYNSLHVSSVPHVNTCYVYMLKLQCELHVLHVRITPMSQDGTEEENLHLFFACSKYLCPCWTTIDPIVAKTPTPTMEHGRPRRLLICFSWAMVVD